jgi:hypothetical protein
LRWFHDLAEERDDLLLDADWPSKRGVNSHYGGFHGDLTSKGYMSVRGIHCMFSCTYLMALQAAGRLAGALGLRKERSALRRRARALSESIRGAFWDEERGCFADTLERETHSVHASLLAVCAGVPDRGQTRRIREYAAVELRDLFRDGHTPARGALASPNFAFYLFDGLYRLGLSDTAERMMRQGWGWMLAKGLRTTAEYFSTDASLCHAWSAAPTYYLSKNLLGVHFPEAPDLDVVEIRVQTRDVQWAEGAFPHPRGAVEVKWHMEGRRRVFDHVRAPEGVRVHIAQPRSEAAAASNQAGGV